MSEPGRPQVFILSSSVDQPSAERLFEMLDGRIAARVTMPLWDTTVDIGREDFENNVASCDVLIPIWGKASAEWLRNVLREFIRLRDVRQRPLRLMMIATDSDEAREAVSKITPLPRSVPLGEVRGELERLFATKS